MDSGDHFSLREFQDMLTKKFVYVREEGNLSQTWSELIFDASICI